MLMMKYLFLHQVTKLQKIFGGILLLSVSHVGEDTVTTF